MWVSSLDLVFIFAIFIDFFKNHDEGNDEGIINIWVHSHCKFVLSKHNATNTMLPVHLLKI